jgi:hypothetical protein
MGKQGAAMTETLEPRRLMSVYYVNAVTGSDANNGRSFRTPWQTLTAVDSHPFRPGDRVLLSGTFVGQSLTLGSNATGVSVDSYSYNPTTRRLAVGVPNVAVLSQVPGDGIDITTSRISIADLTITGGPSADADYFDGIHLINDTDVPLTRETINRVSVSGFGYAGLCMQGWNSSTADSAGFSNVVIENSAFFSNMVSGIFVGTGDNTGNEFTPDFPADFYVNSNLIINHCQAYDNAGYNAALTAGVDPSNINDGNFTSGGIFISSVSNALVENSTAHDNCYNANGSVGIWAFDATRVEFTADESYDNKTTGNADGDAFDLDHGVTHSIMQRDYSHGNDGSGFMITTYGGTSNDIGDIIRYCISDDDGQLNGLAAIHLLSVTGSPLIDEDVYNNTVLTGPADSGTPAALLLETTGGDVINIADNIFYTTGSSPLVVDATPSAETRIQGNDYWAAGASTDFLLDWAGTTYSSLSDWQAGSGSETTSVGQVVGLSENPGLPVETITDLPIANIANLQLPIRSSLRRDGMSLETHAVRYVRARANPPFVLSDISWQGAGPRDYFNRVANHITVGAG